MTPPRKPLLKTTGAAAIVLIGLIATAAQAAAANRQCAAAVERHLRSQGLTATEIARTDYLTVIANREFGSASEYQAWTALESCAGSLVTKLTTTCQIKESYARGNCSLPNAARN